jgi:hypothetical protein
VDKDSLSRRSILGGLAAIAFFEAPAVHAAPEGDPAGAEARQRFAGRFLFRGDAKEEAARLAAIDRTIDSLFFAIRPIARSRLTKSVPIDSWIEFSFPKGTIRTRSPSAPDVVSPDDGSPSYGMHDGDRVTTTQRLVGRTLTQSSSTVEGGRRNDWALSEDDSLKLRVTITSPKLSVPLVYSLTYKRA